MKNWGIRTRVLLLALLPAVMIAVALAGYMVYRVSLDAERELRAYGHGLTRQLAAVAEFSAYSGDQAALRKIALAALDETYISAIAIYDVNGLPIASSGALPARLAVIPPKDPPTQVDGSERGLLFAAPIIFHRLESNDLLFVESSATQQPKPAATIGWVTLTVSLDLMQQRKREAMLFALLATFAVLALGGVLAITLGRQVTQPILRLENTVARIQRGHLEARVISDSGGDLQRLEEGLNAMAETLHENRALLQRRIAVATHELEEKKNEAERSNMAKSRFLAAASHDLRQPLLALSLFAADLRQEAVTLAQQRLSRQINESVGSISDLLDTLLDISRFDLTEVVPQKTALPLSEVFRPLEASFSRLAQNKGLRFRCRPTLLWTHSDPILLERLLGNLLANATAYTASGGVLMAVRRQGDSVRIEVRDSGIGIAPELQHAVFEEFFQVGNAGRVHGQGLGLGLAIVRRIARLLGASVGLRSVPGKGSVFSVVLPLTTRIDLPLQAENGAPGLLPTSGPPALPPSRLALLRPATGPLNEVAALATRWEIEVFWIDSWETLRVGTDNERERGCGIVVAMLEDFAWAAWEWPENEAPALVLLGPAGKAKQAGAHVLTLPLRPAKLRALLNQLLAVTT